MFGLESYPRPESWTAPIHIEIWEPKGQNLYPKKKPQQIYKIRIFPTVKILRWPPLAYLKQMTILPRLYNTRSLPLIRFSYWDNMPQAQNFQN